MDPIVNQHAKYHIPVAAPKVGAQEYEAVMTAMRSNWISSGPMVGRFEETFAQANGKRYGVACASGTLALQLALLAAGVQPGDPVVCPTLTMVAVANAIVGCGAVPYFIDSEPETGNPSLENLLQAVYSTGARVAIWAHLYGQPADPIQRESIWPDGNGRLIGDCAEAHYADYHLPTADGGTQVTPVATLADFACYSFYANKIITTGEGGMVLTNSDYWARQLHALRAHAFTPGQHFAHRSYALGCRMTDICAAMGIAQHKQRVAFLQRREAIANLYTEQLKHLDWLEFPKRSPGSVWWIYPLLVRKDCKITSDRVREVLAEAGVETRTYFYPLHQQKHLRNYAFNQQFPVATDLAVRGFYLPIYTELTDDHVTYIAQQVCSTV